MNQVAKAENPATQDRGPEWDFNLVLDVALGVDEDTICEAYDLQFTQLQRLQKNPNFQSQVDSMKEELKQEGMSFKIKARLQAEEYLKTTFAMVQDPTMDPKIRQRLIEATVRWAGLDAPKSEGSGAGNSFSVTINLPGEGGQTIEGEVSNE